MSMSNPLARRLLLGRRLAVIRKRAERSQADAARNLGVSVSTVNRIEHGTVRTTRADVMQLLDYYNITQEDDRTSVLDLHRDSRQPSWCEGFRPLGHLYVELEDEAAVIETWTPLLVAGLLQIEAYSREVLRVFRPDLDGDRIDQQVELRQERQRRVLSSDRAVHIVLDESTLLRQFGTPHAMRAQLDRIIEYGQAPNFTVQVLPLRTPFPPFLAGDVTFLTLDLEDGLTTFGHSETIVGDVWFDGPDELGTVKKIFSRVQAAALDPDKSSELVYQHILALG